MEIFFETKRMTVSSIDSYDYPDLLKIYNDPKNYQYATGISQNMSQDELEYKINAENHLDGFFFLVGRCKNIRYPCCYIKGQMKKSDPHDNLWISMLLTVDRYRRHGYATELFDSIFHYFMVTYTISTTYVSIHADNYDGLTFWKSLGFSESKHKIRENALLYQRISCNNKSR